MVRVFVSSIDDDVSAVTSSTESSCDERIEFEELFFSTRRRERAS